MAKKENIVFYGTGRRKNAIARVRLVEGNGKITINGKDIDEFFGLETLKVIVRQPLTVTNTTAKYDVIANVKGGGFAGQAGAIRHGIARALLKKPKILILDDSTSAVDTVTDAKIRKAFREEIPDTTKIIIAQRISSVKDADRIIVFDDGKIDGVGTHEELLKSNSIYREVYNQQMNDNADFDKKGGEQ